MTKKSRTILFGLCAFLFLTSAPLVIFYSQGYRFDFENRKITKTGGFYFKIQPARATVSISSRITKKTNLIMGTLLVENIVPGKYQVKIEKEGYFPWTKTLEVKPTEVTEARNVSLVPQRINLASIGNANDFFVSPDGQQTILASNDQGRVSFAYSNTPLLFLNNENYSLLFSSDSQTAIVYSEKDFYLIDVWSISQLKNSGQITEKLASSYVQEINLPPSSKEIRFYPGSKSKIFFISDEKLFLMDTAKRETTQLLNGIISYGLENNSLYYLDKMGFVFKTDPSFVLKNKLNDEPFELKESASYKMDIFQEMIFLSEDKSVYLLGEKTFSLLFPGKNELLLSPNRAKVLVFSDNEINVLYLKATEDQPYKKVLETSFVTRFGEKITSISWLNSHHFTFTIGNRLVVSEIDERDVLNTHEPEFVSAEKTVTLDNPNVKAVGDFLFLLNQNVLYSSANPL